MPPWAYLAARVLGAVVTTSILVAATLGLGVVAYGVDVRTATLPGLLAGLVLGTVCFTSLGIAVTSVIRNADTAPAVVNVLILPLTFVSGIWMTLEGAPSWLTTVAGWFPVRALAHQLQTAFHPGTAGPGLVGRDLAVLAAWTVVGALVAARRFRWESARG